LCWWLFPDGGSDLSWRHLAEHLHLRCHCSIAVSDSFIDCSFPAITGQEAQICQMVFGWLLRCGSFILGFGDSMVEVDVIYL
jgi:hypothetical protein